MYTYINVYMLSVEISEKVLIVCNRYFISSHEQSQIPGFCHGEPLYVNIVHFHGI